MLPEGVGIHYTRLKSEDYTSNNTLARHIDHMAGAASRIQPDLKPDVISFCCPSGSIAIGEDLSWLKSKRTHLGPVPCSLSGAFLMPRMSWKQKNIVGTPFLDEVNTAEAECLSKRCLEILDIQRLNLKTGIEMGRATPAFWKKIAMDINRTEADAILPGCSGIRSREVAEEIEQSTGKPLVTSNHVHFWSCPRRAGIGDDLKGF